MTRFVLSLEPELLARLRELADRNNMSIACLIRTILTERIGRSNEPTACEGPKN